MHEEEEKEEEDGEEINKGEMSPRTGRRGGEGEKGDGEEHCGPLCSGLDHGYSWVDNTDVDVIA